MNLMIKTLSVKTLKISEDCRVSDTFGMWCVGVFVKREDHVNVLIYSPVYRPRLV